MNKDDKSKMSAEALAKIEAMSIKANQRKVRIDESTQRNSKFLRFNNKLTIVLFGTVLLLLMINKLTKQEDKTLEPVSYSDAVTICSEKKMLLPITYEDFGRIIYQPTSKNEIGFWSEERKVFKYPTQMYLNDDGQKHYVYCVKSNGKEARSSFR